MGTIAMPNRLSALAPAGADGYLAND